MEGQCHRVIKWQQVCNQNLHSPGVGLHVDTTAHIFSSLSSNLLYVSYGMTCDRMLIERQQCVYDNAPDSVIDFGAI